MNIKNSILDYIRYKQLNWYGHVRRINEERLAISKKNLAWCPPGRRRRIKRSKKGIPRNSWMHEVPSGMREKGINNLEWISLF